MSFLLGEDRPDTRERWKSRLTPPAWSWWLGKGLWTKVNMAATGMFQRRNIDLFKTIILRLPRSRLCSVDGRDEEQSNENISDDPEAVLQAKKLDLVVPSLRVDRVLASALGIGRRLVVNINFSTFFPYTMYCLQQFEKIICNTSWCLVQCDGQLL